MKVKVSEATAPRWTGWWRRPKAEGRVIHDGDWYVPEELL